MHVAAKMPVQNQVRGPPAGRLEGWHFLVRTGGRWQQDWGLQQPGLPSNRIHRTWGSRPSRAALSPALPSVPESLGTWPTRPPLSLLHPQPSPPKTKEEGGARG